MLPQARWPHCRLGMERCPKKTTGLAPYSIPCKKTPPKCPTCSAVHREGHLAGLFQQAGLSNPRNRGRPEHDLPTSEVYRHVVTKYRTRYTGAQQHGRRYSICPGKSQAREARRSSADGRFYVDASALVIYSLINKIPNSRFVQKCKSRNPKIQRPGKSELNFNHNCCAASILTNTPGNTGESCVVGIWNLEFRIFLPIVRLRHHFKVFLCREGLNRTLYLSRVLRRVIAKSIRR